MNLLHMRYVVEVAEIGSLNKAAEKLYVGQSNLSRAIKELEASLGVAIFDRSAKGMALTAEGEIFVAGAKDILQKVDGLSLQLSQSKSAKKRFSVSVPRASYAAEAFVRFAAKLPDNGNYELCYRETNALQGIDNILHEDYKLAVIRHAQAYEDYYKTLLAEKGLSYQKIASFRHLLVMSKKHPLAECQQISRDMLKPYVEIAHGDPYVPYLPFAQVKKEELPLFSGSRIFVFERCSQFQLLHADPRTFMLVSPIPRDMLERYELVQIPCPENSRVYCDMLIYRKDHSFSPLDQQFIQELTLTKEEFLAYAD